MKKIVLLLLFVPMLFAAYGQTTSAPAAKSGPVIKFIEKMHDFGDIYEGDSVKYVFKFKNEGNAPLILSEVLTTCGCTAPKWNRDPIMPGATGEIKILFKSEGKSGIVNKVITVLSNATNSPDRISIRVNVLPPKKE